MSTQKPRLILLTPGPLTTSEQTKQAMLRDWGSRDRDFIQLTARVRERLVDIVNGAGRVSCVPVQGSGTFAVEAMIGTMVPPTGHLLIMINGAYGQRMAAIADRLGRRRTSLDFPEDRPLDPSALAQALAAHAEITHVAVVHCETTSGVHNPLDELARVTKQYEKFLLVDSMSAFGALPIDIAQINPAAIAASANKCLEGVPGVGFVLADENILAESAGQAPSLSLDLYDQWRGFEANGQWRFTPPTHVLAALDDALDQLDAEGGPRGRLARYTENCRCLVAGMRAMGFETLLDDAHQAPIIVTFRIPDRSAFDFTGFYEALHSRGVVIYPGKVTDVESFRMGCIGAIDRADIERALAAVAEVLKELGFDL